MPKGIPNKGYSGEFKIKVVETMRKGCLSYAETVRRFEIRSRTKVKRLEYIYLEEGKKVLLAERRGRTCRKRLARKSKLDKKVEEDLIEENE